jgi:hypothetical protein
MRSYVIALPQKVYPVTGNYTFGEETQTAAIEPGFASGSTIALPGPSSGHNPPNNGDTYAIVDPQNVLSGGSATVTIFGGGYPLLAVVGGVLGLHSGVSFGSLLFGLVGEGNNPLKEGIIFAFDGFANVWIEL